MGENKFAIYQLQDNSITRGLRFEMLNHLEIAGRSVDWGNYKHVYTGALEKGGASATSILEALYSKFNLARPEDFVGHSLSVSDIVVLHQGGKASPHYVDSFGFKEVPEFLAGPYKYYSTQRPVDIATYPSTDGGPVSFVNFDKRELCENATFRAWGYLAYDAPLTVKQIGDYELRAASGNPDNVKVSPYQLEAQLEAIGKWETAHGLSDRARITWYHGDTGTFVKKDWVMAETVSDRFDGIIEQKARNAERRVEQKLFADYGISDAPGSSDEKKRMIEQAQVVGHWEDDKGMPDNERFAWHKPSIHAYALREPAVSPDQLEQRYHRAKLELTRDSEKQPTPKRIADQLAEAGKQVQRGADLSAKEYNKSHEDR